MVDLIDTNGVKPTLKKGVLGYDDYNAGGDAGRLYVGTGTASIAQAKKSEVDSHTSNVSNPHSVTKTQVGLGNVDNTSDANKPVSTATQTALNTKVDKVTSTDNAIVRFNGTTGDVQNSGVIINDNGTINFPTGARITGDFSNATVSNRVAFQSSTLNDTTYVSAIPNGTSTNTGFVCYAGSDINNSSFGDISNNGAYTRIRSSKAGTGSYLPIALFTSDTERMRIDTAGNVLLTSGTGGLGYGTGAGGTVTQLTSKSTAVTLNKPSGIITMNNAALAAGASTSFVVNNTTVVAGGSTADNVVVSIFGGISGYSNYRIQSSTINGGFVITLTNQTGISLSEAVMVKFDVIKGATA